MKLSRLLTLFILCFLMVGCSTDQTADSSADEQETITNINQLSPDQVAQLYHQEQVGQAIGNHLAELTQASSTHTLNFTSADGTTISKQQENYETFEQDELTSFYIKSSVQNDGQPMEEAFSFKDNKYTRYFNHQIIEESESATKQATTYLTYLKFLVESEVPFEVVEQNDETTVIRLPINSSDQLTLLLDLPIILSNQAEAEASIDYTVDSQSGAIQAAKLTGTLTDLGQTYQLENTMDAKTNEAATVMEPAGGDNQFKDQEVTPDSLQAANPVDNIIYYESVVSQTIGEDIKNDLYLFNTIGGKPYMTLISPIIDNQADNVGVFYNENYYPDGGDHQPLMQPTNNPYKELLNRLIDQWENVTDVEMPEGEAILKREVFEDDFDSLQAIVPYIDLSALKRDGAAAYAIDYVINQETNQLASVLFWSLTGDEEEITHHIVLTFDRLNLYTPSVLGPSVSDEVWQQVTSNISE